MKQFEYSYNWNNKLSCAFHTTLRLRNDEKHVIGEVFEEVIKSKKKDAELVKFQDVVLIGKKHLYLKDINDFIAYLDTGYDKDKCIELIKTMYKNKNLNWETQQLDFLLLGVQKNSILKPNAANDKIAMFARKYEKATGIKYKVTAAEIGKLKLVEMTDDLLDFYFATTDFKLREKSIGNYVKYYNYIRQLFVNPDLYIKPKFPNEYNANFERNLNPADLTEYRKHLYSLGWKVTQRPGQAEHWTFIKPQQ